MQALFSVAGRIVKTTSGYPLHHSQCMNPQEPVFRRVAGLRRCAN